MLPPDWSASLVSFFRDDFHIYTWVLLGALFNIIVEAFLGRIGRFLTVCVIVANMFIYVLRDRGIMQHPGVSGVREGRWSIRLPDSTRDRTRIRPGQQGVTLFILAGRSNHIRGRFANGCQELSGHFDSMWKACLDNRKHNGFLGKTSSMTCSEHDCNNTMVWITYWKDLKCLQDFAASEVHREGAKWYLTEAQKKFPTMGITHETYEVPPGHWEGISYNARPWGLAASQHYHGGVNDASAIIDPMIPARGTAWASMEKRMGRKYGAEIDWA